ncbi:MAG TPA: alpha/beta hydrolase [Dehalococcoidia bacterium]|nr:alpha/beta hydrolase [Dehalococcoidia bacterium]
MRLKEITEYPHYDVSGSGHKKTILLLHGIAVTRKMWAPQMISMSSSYQLLAPDLPSHGSRSHEMFTFERALAGLKTLLEETDCNKVLVVGFSLGGYLASEFVNHYPDRVNGLVLVSSSTVPKGLVSIPYHLLAFLYRIIDHRWLAKREARLWRSRYGAMVAEPVIKAGFYHKAVSDLEKEIGGKDFLSGLMSFEKPVLIINGEKDRIFRRGERLYREKIKNSKVVVMGKAGHRCLLDSPEEFNRHLLEFADSLVWE